MDAPAGFVGRLHRCTDLRVGSKTAVTDGIFYARVILEDNPAGTDVHVPHLGVAHLSLGQADRGARGFDQAVWFIPPKRIPTRRGRQRDCIGRPLGAHAPAIEDHQQKWFAV
jgi:hypothetical protein